MVKQNTHYLFRVRFSLLVALAFSVSGVSLAQSQKKETLQLLGSTTITVDLSKQHQTIDNFAASDAWACQFVGNWPEQKKNAIADLLFSKKLLPDGRPEGIGLSMWRFNIGAGSAQQSRESGIKDEWRRAESFLQADGKYDWSRQAGQMWFLEAAKKRGVEQFLAFTNSPPVQFTKNGKAFANSGKPNLSSEKFNEFADFLASVTKNVYNKTGVLFNYLSPVNEPQWDWSNGGQEGTPFTNSDISGITKALDAALVKNNLPSKITITEAGDYKYLYSAADKPDKASQIDTFFNPTSTDYIGNLPSVEKLISGHSYFTTSPYSTAVSVRQDVAEKVSSVPGLRFWQSEYCILGDNAGEIDGKKRDLGIDAALYLAKVIHNDLVNANASAWHWWLAVSPYNYKDGLIYIDKNKTGGNFYPSKMLWALGNYSRFISPGAVRIEAAVNSESSGLLVSAYQNKEAKELITVVINSNPRTENLNLKLGAGDYRAIKHFTTSATADLAPGEMEGYHIILPAKSITTIIAGIK